MERLQRAAETVLDEGMPGDWGYSTRTTKNLLHVTAKRPNNEGTYQLQTSNISDVHEFVAMCNMFAMQTSMTADIMTDTTKPTGDTIDDAIMELANIMCGEPEICEEHWEAAESAIKAGYRRLAERPNRAVARGDGS